MKKNHSSPVEPMTLESILDRAEDDLRETLESHLRSLVFARFGFDSKWGRIEANHCDGMSRLRATRDDMHGTIAPHVMAWLRGAFMKEWKQGGSLTKLHNRWKKEVFERLMEKSELSTFLKAAHPHSRYPSKSDKGAWENVARRLGREDARRDAERIFGRKIAAPEKRRW